MGERREFDSLNLASSFKTDGSPAVWSIAIGTIGDLDAGVAIVAFEDDGFHGRLLGAGLEFPL